MRNPAWPSRAGNQEPVDEMKLREAMYGGNPAGVIAVLADRDPQDVLQLVGAALLLALREHVPTTPAVATEVEVALRRRD
ncbi:MAG TPA: hypothetical protein VFQ15_06325, partial [Jiangellaceae bacterium]|nr:hypothetical protein [Jiangellaceae bacterium]